MTETIGEPRTCFRDSLPSHNPDGWESISGLIAASGELAGRTLLSDDPALGFDDPCRPLNDRLRPVPDRPGRPQRPLAVLLIEPADALMTWDPVTNRRRDLLAELLVQRGFQRFAIDMPLPGPAAGWTLQSEDHALALRDRGANAWAHPAIVPNQPWRAAAARHGHVLVLLGSCLGVRIPEGIPGWQYGPRQRAAELKQGRLCGLVVAAAVPWWP